MANYGSRWRHVVTGETYTMLYITNVSATREGWPTTVVYQGKDGKVWSRPIEDFKRRMYLLDKQD